MDIFVEILKGAFIGFLSVLIGWSKKQKPGKFNVKGLLLRVPTGIVVGAIAGYYGWDLAQAEQFAAGFGIILVVDNIAKIVINRFELAKKLREFLDMEKLEEGKK